MVEGFMVVQGVELWLIGAIVSVITICFLFLIFMVSRYRKFQINQFVIHLRNGKLQRAGIGGSVFLLPLIDEIIVIPSIIIHTPLTTLVQVFSEGHKLLKIKGELLWQVNTPEKAYKSVSWHSNDENFVERILNSSFGAIYREICGDYSIKEIIQNQLIISENLKIGLKSFTADWGIEIKALNIRRVKIMEKEHNISELNNRSLLQ